MIHFQRESRCLCEGWANITVRRVRWYWLAAAELAISFLIWVSLLFASAPHYRCPQDDVGAKQRLSWLAFVILDALILALVSAVARRLRISPPAAIIISAFAMLPLLLFGAYVRYAINSDWRCGNT